MEKVQFNKLQQINIFPTLARQSGISFSSRFQKRSHIAIPHYKKLINTPNVIKMPVGEIAYRKLAQNGTVLNGVNRGGGQYEKDASQTKLRNVLIVLNEWYSDFLRNLRPILYS